MQIENLITEHIETWTSAIKKKSASGRGTSKKIELYGIKKLRELILELAVRGKLVPQDANDEPASALLESIAEEKAQLVKEKKIRKAKITAPSDMPSVNFTLPNGWALPILENLVLNSSDHIVDGPFGSKLKATEYVDTGVPIIRIQNVGRMKFKNNGLKYLTDEKAKDLDRHNFTAGDIVLNKLGEPTGKTCVIPNGVPNGIIVADIVRVRIDNIFHNKNYLVTALNSPFVANQFSGLAKGVTRQRVNLSQIRSLSIPLPPIKEQLRVSDKFNELMLLCDKLEQQTESSIDAHKTLVEVLLNTLTDSKDSAELQSNWARVSEFFDTLFTTEHSIDQLKQTILQLAVMGKLVPQDPSDEPASKLLERIAAEKVQLIADKKIKKQKALPPITDEEEPFVIPNGWEWCRLPDLGDLARGKSKHRPRNDPKLYESGKIPLVQTGDVSRANGIVETYTALYNETGLAQSKLWPKGTLCITIAANIADTAILGFDACFPDSVVGYTPFENQIPTKYFDYFIRTAKANLEKFAPSTAQKNINLEILSQVLVPCPPLNEFKRVVDKIDSLFCICEQLKSQLNQAQQTQLNLTDAIVEKAV